MKYFMIMDSIFKKTLRAELDYQDIKVKELAARTGISPRTIESYLSARGSIPPADVAVKIAQALKISVEYLVTGNASYNSSKNQQINYQTPIEEKISTLPIEKKILLKNFITLLDDFEISER